MLSTRDIAVRAGPMRWNDLPPEVQHSVRLCFADGIAVMLGAVRLEPAVLPFAAHARSHGPGPAHLLAGGTAPPVAAALANGALSHALDFEDTFDAVGLHVNAAIIPTVLALAESEGKTLGEALTAMALGAELACRLGLSLTNDPGARGWYFPPMIGAIGAALAGAHLLRLDADQTIAALSLAQVQFSLTDALKRAPASDLRAVRDGFAARAATEAILLARAGVTGTDDPLFERGGVIPLLTGDAADPAPLAAFAHDFLTPTLTLKLWPACRGTHPAIALALALRDEGLTATDIKAAAFTVEPPDDMLFEPRADRIRPQTAIGAKFSIPFTFAHTLIHGAPGLSAFSKTARHDADVRALASRITLRACAEGAGRTAHLTLASGETDRALAPPPPLTAGSATMTDLAAKFRDCIGDRPDALSLLHALDTTDPEKPVSDLVAQLAYPDPSTKKDTT
ncbi:MmgE/PrpD family protein [Rhodobacterales bacterium HKCCE4037]|nr:MmgE/PrpD family protein [Rhodobacterales bacterium HKCCE4037]